MCNYLIIDKYKRTKRSYTIVIPASTGNSNWVSDGYFYFILKEDQVILCSIHCANWEVFTVEGQDNFYPL